MLTLAPRVYGHTDAVSRWEDTSRIVVRFCSHTSILRTSPDDRWGCGRAFGTCVDRTALMAGPVLPAYAGFAAGARPALDACERKFIVTKFP